ncbi:hypothetical protein ABZ927_27870 [Streptomyces massasporeus]
MSSPQFISPEFNEPKHADQAQAADRWDPITLKAGDERLTVTNFSRELPPQPDLRSRTKLVRAGKANPYCSLPEDAWHTLSRAVVYPAAVTAQLHHDPAAGGSSLTEEHVGGATLRSAGNARIWLTEAFPLVQPRIGPAPHPEADPEIDGATEDGTAQAMLVYRFRNRSHLKNYLRQTIIATRDVGNRYDESILTRRVTRAIVAHVARLEFEDETEPVYVLVVRDGITRVVSAWGALCGEHATPDEIADRAAGVLLAEKPPRRGAEKPLSQRMGLGRQGELERLRAKFTAGMSGNAPNEEAIRIGQTLVLPAQVAVGLQVHPGAGLPPGEVFNDAVRSILASIHVDFRMWESAAQNVEVGSRALKLTALDGDIDTAGVSLIDVYKLAVGHRDSDQVPEIFNNAALPRTPLWRAVALVHFLTRKPLFTTMKKHVRAIGGKERIRDTAYAEILGPIVDHPWRVAKRETLSQARNAWATGGVLTKEVIDCDWQPQPCADFTDLVDEAKSNDDARLTLAVAGGVALIADKLLTRDVGSKKGVTVPYRAAVNEVIKDLSRADNKAGLLLLAHAANRFDASHMAVNSFTDKQLVRGDQAEADYYTQIDVDPDAEDGIARDGAGVPLRLNEWRVAVVANREKAREGEQAVTGAEFKKTVLEQLADQRHKLRERLTEAQEAITQLMRLGNDPDAAGTHPLGSHDEWQRLSNLAVKVQATISVHEPEDAEDHEEGDAEEQSDGE